MSTKCMIPRSLPFYMLSLRWVWEHHCSYPSDTWRNNNVIIASKRCCDVVMTFSYSLSREYRVVRNRYSRLLFTSEDRLCANLRVQEQSTNMTSQYQYPTFTWPAPNHYLNWCCNSVNWTIESKFQWNLNWNWSIFIKENAFENVGWKMSAILSRPRCVNA